MSKPLVHIELDEKSAAHVRQALKEYDKDSEGAIMRAILLLGKNIEVGAKMRLNGMLGSAKHWVTGRLANSIHTETKTVNTYGEIKIGKSPEVTGANDGNLGIPVGELEAVVGTNVEYAADIEFGHPEKIITPVNAKALRFKPKGSNTYIFRKKAVIPASSGESFLQWAANNRGKNFAKLVKQEINKETDRFNK